MRDELIDVAKAVLADLPLFECQSFHHRPEDRHTSFDCPVLARFCANVAKMREALRTPRPESRDGDKDAKDAARYRWLRDVGDPTWRPFGIREGFSAAQADAVIDKAIKSEERP